MDKSLIKNLFKIRKVNYYGEDTQGVVMPYLYQGCGSKKIDEEIFYLVTYDGRKLQLNTNMFVLKSTKIINKDIKDFFDKIIVTAKKTYKIQQQLIALKQKENCLYNELKNIDISIQEQQQNFIKNQGYLNENDCLNYLKSNLTIPNDYELKCDCLGLKIRTINLQKNVDVDKEIYLKKSFDELKDLYFKTIPKSIIDGYNLDAFYADIPGKDNYCIHHLISLSFGGNMDRKKEMLDKKLSQF